MTTLHSRKSIDRSPLRRGFRFGALALVLACCALPLASRALLPPPPPDGGYPNGNTAEGDNALFNLTTGSQNTATGWRALYSNTTGDYNTASGFIALFSNTIGFHNVAAGKWALFSNTSGNYNTALGNLALLDNTTGDNNIAVGLGAGRNLTTGSNNIEIGNAGLIGENNSIRIGIQGTQRRTFIAGIKGGFLGAGATPVYVDNTGHLGTVPSAARYKQDVTPMEQASEAVLKLKPVTFRYKHELDADEIPQFGLIAEQVEKVNPDLVVRDKDGKVTSVRYDAVNAMLLNEFLKEHRTVQEQQKEIDALKAELKEQRALIQKVNDKVELDKPAPQIVINDQ